MSEKKSNSKKGELMISCSRPVRLPKLCDFYNFNRLFLIKLNPSICN